MELILNNPYRIVGLLVGATAREQERQVKRLKQFIEAEQEPQDDFSLPKLGNLHRTLDKVNEAASKLNLDSDKMNAALFWFYIGNQISDEPAFDAIKEADLDQVLSIWTKLTSNGEISQRNASAYSNLGTLYLSGILAGTNTNEALLEKGISLKLKFLESDYIKDFKALATDETFKTTKKDLQLIFLNQVQSEVDRKGGVTSQKFLEILNKQTFSAKEEFLKGFIQKPIEQIEKKIEEAKTKRKANKANAFSIGKALFEQSSESLSQLKSILGVSDIKFSSITDKVSDEILQCGIDYFQHYKETSTDPGSSSMDLFRKAKTLAIGNIAKQRCQENTENLQEWIENKPERELQQKVGEEVDFIIKQFNLAAETLKNKGKYPKGYNDPYSKLPLNEQPHNKVVNVQNKELDLILRYDPTSPFSINEYHINLFRLSRDIVKKCKPKLDAIKLAVGSTNEIYQKLSNDIASLALACLIDYVNGKVKSVLVLPKSVGENEINSMNAIGELDMNFETRKRYNEQKKSLNNLHKATQNRSSTSSSGSSGCYIATMAYGDYDHPQVMILRQFRDDVLDKSVFGKWFIKTYYHYSPKLVIKLKNKKGINAIIRKTLNQFITLIK
jgi:hypothetical protein